MKPKGYSILEIISYIVISAILFIPITQIVVANYHQTKAFTDRQSLQTLNQAIELYRLSGGRSVAHSLMGENTSEKIENVIGVLENGIMRNGQRVRFIAPLSTAQLSALTASGQGNGFTFKLVNQE